MISKVNGDLPIRPVRPELIFSTDDTVNYIFEGKGTVNDCFRLVGTKALQSGGTRSKYKNDDSNHMCGLRVKITYTFSAAGTMAPIFISVLGLNDRELPNDDCISMKIEGLCVGGGGINVGSKQCGTLLFMKGKGCDRARYEIYKEEVFLPFVKNTRIEYGCWIEGSPIAEDLKSVSWSDGDAKQVETIVSESSIDIYKENMIVANKQNAARSGTEQAADLTKTFKIMNLLQNKVTVSNISCDRHPMKRIINSAMKNLSSSNKLVLKPTKHNAIVDFISSVPEMTSKAVTRDNITHGFKENGMIDNKYLRYPDLNKILATCRRDPTIDEYNNCIEHFPFLYNMYSRDGHVSDDVFEELGFPMDSDRNNKAVHRTADINQENRQRAKCLTHIHQVELREERTMLIQADIYKEKADKLSLLNSKINDNTICEEKIMNILQMDNIDNGSDITLNDASLEMFDKCNLPDLIAFILVRRPDLTKSKIPKKGKLVDAKKGGNNCILLAYECRSMPNQL